MGPGHPGRGGRAGTKAIRASAWQSPERAGGSRPGAATAAPRARKRRGLLCGGKSSPGSGPSPSLRPYRAPGPEPQHLRGHRLPAARGSQAAQGGSCWVLNRAAAAAAAAGLQAAEPAPGGRRVRSLSCGPSRQLRNNLTPLPPSSPGPRTLTPPTRSHTIPEASGTRALCRSGVASGPGPEMAAEQRKSGLRRAPVRLAGGRGPPLERSPAVALATAAGLGQPRPGPGKACGPALDGARQQPLSPRCSVWPLPAAGLTSSLPLRPAPWPQPLARERSRCRSCFAP